MGGFDSRLKVEDRISKIKNRSIKNLQTEALKFKKRGGWEENVKTMFQC